MTKFLYIRTKNSNPGTRGDPIGCVASEFDSVDQCVYYALSIANPRDHFKKNIAREIANGRLDNDQVRQVDLEATKPTAIEITHAIMRDISANVEVPVRVRRSAQMWIEEFASRRGQTSN